MTKPTQAQIEAAAQAIFTARMLRNDGKWDCQIEARAALTAAAEVGLYAGMQVNKDGLVLKYTDKDLDDTEAATIERCARVAEMHPFDPHTARQIAAAIMALKEKP